MPTARAVPKAPRMAYLYRRIARLPAGGPSGFACAAAGIACALGVVFVGPNSGRAKDPRAAAGPASRRCDAP